MLNDPIAMVNFDLAFPEFRYLKKGILIRHLFFVD